MTERPRRFVVLDMDGRALRMSGRARTFDHQADAEATARALSAENGLPYTVREETAADA